MKKVLFVGSNSIHCERYLSGLVATSQFEIAVITNTFLQGVSQYLPQYEMNFGLHSLKTAKQILKIIKEFQPQVVHIQQANSYAWHTLRAIAKLKIKPKVVLTCWGSDVLVLPNQSKLMHKIVKYNLVNVDVITADSFYMLTKINELLNGVDKPCYNINFGIKNIPTVAKLTEQKNKYVLSNRLHKKLYRIDKIVLAFAELVNQNLIDAEYKLLIAASGSETQNLEELVQKYNILDRVEFVGMLSYTELTELYKKSTVFVSVPESDGTASSLLESMAYGCIPVLSNLPANLEWVIDKINGIIEPNLQHLSQSILSAIQISQDLEKYQELCRFNYQLIEQKALFNNNIHKFIELY